mgnify:CR=1 FL=1
MDLVGRNKQDVLSKQDVQRMRVKDNYVVLQDKGSLFKIPPNILQDLVPSYLYLRELGLLVQQLFGTRTTSHVLFSQMDFIFNSTRATS